jgi:hypothetical protein
MINMFRLVVVKATGFPNQLQNGLLYGSIPLTL